MRIVIIEYDTFYLKLAKEGIVQGFPGVEVISFRNVGDFLVQAEELRNADAVVMEHFLPLVEYRPDHDSWVASLTTQFPEVVKSWDHQEGGERLVRWMRRNDMKMPVLFQTHSPENRIVGDVVESNVYYHRKSTRREELAESVKAMLGN